MQRYLFFLAIFCFFYSPSFAQNWRTINPADTVYFKSNATANGSYLRLIYIDSTAAAGADSIFYFYKSYRIPIDSSANAVCVDTMAATWLGYNMLRKTNGDELYYNYFNDTILVKTLAATGDNWQLMKDSLGTVFLATVTAMGTTMVDGVADSTKTITIQAYQNGVPVYSTYNNTVFELSKAHGWLKTLDMYRFPYSLENNSLNFGAVMDSTQHVRLNKDFGNADMISPDLSLKYMPGNEWICHYDYLDGANPGPNHIVTYDSVMNSLALSAGSALVSLKTDSFSVYYDPAYPHVDTIIKTSTTYHTDTIRMAPVMQIKKNVLQEVRAGRYWISYGPAMPVVNTHFTVIEDSCSSKDILRYFSSYITMYKGTDCYTVNATSVLQGSLSDTTDILPGFGPVWQRHGSLEHSGATSKYRNTYYTYLKLGSCISGVKKNILNDSTDNVPGNLTILLAPNPVQHTLTITIPGKDMICRIYNATGNMVYSEQLTSEKTSISADFLQPGLYIIQASGSSGKYTQKFIKQ